MRKVKILADLVMIRTLEFLEIPISLRKMSLWLLKDELLFMYKLSREKYAHSPFFVVLFYYCENL